MFVTNEGAYISSERSYLLTLTFSERAYIRIFAFSETLVHALMLYYRLFATPNCWSSLPQIRFSGIEYNMARVPMASTDFSTHEYSYDDVDGDFDLQHFALTEEDLSYKVRSCIEFDIGRWMMSYDVIHQENHSVAEIFYFLLIW